MTCYTLPWYSFLSTLMSAFFLPIACQMCAKAYTSYETQTLNNIITISTMKTLYKKTGLALCIVAALSACNQESKTTTASPQKQQAPKALTAKDAENFLIETEKEIVALNLEGARAQWIYANFITEDTSALASASSQKSTEAGVRHAMEAAKFDDVDVTADQRRKLDILIVVSSGNYNGSEIINNWRDDYPSYLLSEDAALIDPAPAANVLTVGSFAKHTMSYAERRYQPQGEINELHVASEGQVSPFSRSSQNSKSALKPELLAHGGNFAIPARREGQGWSQTSKHLGVVTLNHNPLGNTLLSEFSGTSFSAPYIAHLAGRLLNNYPQASANLLRALLANHANVTQEITSTFETKEQIRRVAGYGVVDEDSLFKSSEEHVVLISEEKIENDKHQFFEIPIPDDYFRKGKATRTITASLAYRPSVRTTRLEYIATKMKFHLINGDSLDSVAKAFNNDNKKVVKSISECDGNKRDLTQDDRSRGTLQSSTWTFNQFNKPRKLFLVVTRQDQPWAQNLVADEESYALAISITDRENEEAKLYQQISEKLKAREEVKQRAKVNQ